MRTLAEACTDLLLLAIEVQRKAVEVPDAHVLRQRIKTKLDDMADDAERLGLGRADIEDAKYAVVATIDELVHMSGRAAELGFQINPLQAELFGDRNAGVRFFERLERVRERGERSVLEVYHLCLSLGFKGVHRVDGEQDLARLIDDLDRDLDHSRGALSPKGAREGPPPPAVKDFPWNAVLGGAVGIAVIVAVVLLFVLRSASEEAVKVLGGG